MLQQGAWRNENQIFNDKNIDKLSESYMIYSS